MTTDSFSSSIAPFVNTKGLLLIFFASFSTASISASMSLKFSFPFSLSFLISFIVTTYSSFSPSLKYNLSPFIKLPPLSRLLYLRASLPMRPNSSLTASASSCKGFTLFFFSSILSFITSSILLFCFSALIRIKTISFLSSSDSLSLLKKILSHTKSFFLTMPIASRIGGER